jgi:DNA-binding transcriptional regulator YiaG
MFVCIGTAPALGRYVPPVDAGDLEVLAWARRALESGEARDIRERAPASQSELGRVVGVAAATISRWEGSKRTPRGSAGVRYAHLLKRLAADA